MQQVEQQINASAAAFQDKLWPKISHVLGGGRIVCVESVSDRDFFRQCLDMYGGIDTWHVNDDRSLMRGLATRMQKPLKVRFFKSLTIRYRKRSGNDTEIHKRMKALQEPDNWLHPSIVIQGYFTNANGNGFGDPTAVAIAKMNDVIRIVCEGEQGTSYRDTKDWYLQSTSEEYGQYDWTEFAVIPIDTLKRKNLKHAWIEF